MPRTTDDPFPSPLPPLGKPEPRPTPAPPPQWKKREGSPGIYEDAQGHMRTDIPLGGVK